MRELMISSGLGFCEQDRKHSERKTCIFHEGVKFLCSDKGAYQDIEEQQKGSSPFVLSIQHPFQSSYG